MVIRTELVPFSLVFEQHGRPVELPFFYKDEYDIPEQVYITILENVDVAVLFQSDEEDSRLYMEGLEGAAIKVFAEEEGEPYLRPSLHSKLLFSHDSFPLIPGDYLIKVYCRRNWYYTMVRVVPKQMTESQLQVMKDEIEGFLKGLAREIVLQKNNAWSAFRVNGRNHFYVKHRILEKHYRNVLPAVIDLAAKANYRTKKEYTIVPKHQAKKIDAATVAHQLQHPERQHELKVPIQQVNYDLPENRWLKKMAAFVRKELRAMQEEIEQHQGGEAKWSALRQEMQQAAEVAAKIQKLQKAFFLLESAPWFADVQRADTAALPHAVHTDFRYRAVFQMYREFKNETKAELRPSHSLRWKRTDKLYEIWGFIQFLQILIEKLQFVPVAGWIFSDSFIQMEDVVPTLQENTKLILRKGDIKLHFVYEGEIPLNSEDSDYDNPLFTESTHNKPDMRMDFFHEDIYMGSLLFDFKYRPLYHIWDVTKVSQKTSTMRKLVQYAVSCKSNFLFGIKEARYIRPVHEVWAIHPNLYNNYPVSKKYDDHDIRVVQLSPKHPMDHIEADLLKVIEEILAKRELLSQHMLR
ncbi:MAG: DUF2357 domain-containing protein [Ectobacillus sp.]